MPKFLVIQAARFGDLVQTKRLLLSLALRGEVHLAVDVSLVPLARVLYPFAELHALSVHGRPEAEALARNTAVLDRWQGLPFEAVYNCNFSGTTAALCRVFEVEQVQGYRPEAGGISRSPWARLGFRLSERRALATMNLVDFWAHFAPEPVEPRRVNPVATPGGRGLGVVLAGRESRRSLPVPVLAEVVRTAFGALGGPRILLLGSRAEQPAARQLLRQLPGKMLDRVEDCSGKTDWPSLVDAVDGLDALITPDTGIMHLGAHLGVPVLGFFLSSAWLHETGPYGEGHHVWQTARSCGPCLETAPCPYDVACGQPLAQVELLRSIAAVLARLKSGAPFAVAQAESWPPLPADLQLWRTGMDSLGTLPHLLAGSDPHAQERRRVRDFLAARLHLPMPDESAALAPQAPNLDEWLYNDADWMLPPGRYC
ncbi:Heptosyltransferase family protein [uncultured Desulfovibrio sp.]|uniref:Heptosyltransferase family protein n=1 Tax=uncultured Desulfovibrio sp. TaxID=167968 RepID=A0A212J035_9BACT|nr:glycosyltransferase family 9 protein [Desulfovibrio desulfuricans]MCB6540831.1 glycosyltransferase family 9 protein [Desulfovibrio desulfuricans]MCB6551913.1 glycosyltransferase family 9 protein [Desulfovibrio desulfuricans]MCB6563755.1 glycosyltransferase family 9 protein [Desulfovibrio desulfuricans]MCB7344655.1 glycosyltransferase family 9 protein [Desulfovibrio desulfuricans]MCQ4860364.1 glycosyltransferase family 9 protein [Desulfovibrio desulfuricans]